MHAWICQQKTWQRLVSAFRHQWPSWRDAPEHTEVFVVLAVFTCSLNSLQQTPWESGGTEGSFLKSGAQGLKSTFTALPGCSVKSPLRAVTAQTRLLRRCETVPVFPADFETMQHWGPDYDEKQQTSVREASSCSAELGFLKESDRTVVTWTPKKPVHTSILDWTLKKYSYTYCLWQKFISTWRLNRW